MASKAYPAGTEDFLSGELDWDSATVFKAMLVLTGYTYSNAHDFYDDVSASQYAATTDQTLVQGNRVVSRSGDNTDITYTTTVTWSSVAFNTGDAIGVIIYEDTGTPATSRLVCFDDCTGDVTPNGGDITYTPATNVLVRYAH